jgi:hypothetical protein
MLPSLFMRHALKLVLAALLSALVPINATTTATRKSRTTARTSSTERKSQNVKGYTTKKGRRVAPYKRHPAK